ncbi:hypothetical protein BD779DRAFT_298641 [Infundibulicybe gibba]|nr:hypothetical protein BD779DRAFT_298641 [Infundibulicybe gibba]
MGLFSPWPSTTISTDHYQVLIFRLEIVECRTSLHGHPVGLREAPHVTHVNFHRHHIIQEDTAIYSHYLDINRRYPASGFCQCQLGRSMFNGTQDNMNYHNHNQHTNTRGGDSDVRSFVHSAMKDHIYTDVYHDSGAQRAPSRCYPGTREVALQAISRWVWDPASHCFWLHGPAGTGKSAIAQTFAEQCHQDGTLGASYFFIKGLTSGPARGLPPLFSTIAYQLMLAFPGLDEHLWAALCADRKIFEKSLSAQVYKLIVQPFRKLQVADDSDKAIVIIDGLDECDGDSIQGEISQLILGLEQHSLPLLFLISSRPEPEIQRAFESSCSSSTRHSLDKVLHPDHDIHHFLCTEFERIYMEMSDSDSNSDLDPDSDLEFSWPPTEKIEELVRRSSGHLIYAETVIRLVEDHTCPMDQLNVVLGIPNGSASSSVVRGISTDTITFQELDTLYLYILRKHQNRAELIKILHAIMYFGSRGRGSQRSPDELEIIFGLKRGSVYAMLYSIIDIPADDKPPDSGTLLSMLFSLTKNGCMNFTLILAISTLNSPVHTHVSSLLFHPRSPDVC